jgi:hypothetical protein
MSQVTTLRRRLRDVRRHLRQDPSSHHHCLRPTSQFGTKGAPDQGAFSAHSSGGSSRHDLRLRGKGVSSPYGKTEGQRIVVEGFDMQSNLPQALGERESPCLFSGQGTVLALGHSSGRVLPRGATRLREVREELVRDRQRSPAS